MRSGRYGNYQNTADRLQDIAEMKSAGETFERIATRLGITPDGLYKWLHRNGFDDLARELKGAS
jgi:transposase-like protein